MHLLTDGIPNGKDHLAELEEDLSVEVSKLSLSNEETVEISITTKETGEPQTPDSQTKKKKKKFRTPSFLKKSKKKKDEKEKVEAWGH